MTKVRWVTVSFSPYFEGRGAFLTEAWGDVTRNSGEVRVWHVGFTVCFPEMFREARRASVVPSWRPCVCTETFCSLTPDEIGICTAEEGALVCSTLHQAGARVILNPHTPETCSLLASWVNPCQKHPKPVHLNRQSPGMDFLTKTGRKGEERMHALYPDGPFL